MKKSMKIAIGVLVICGITGALIGEDEPKQVANEPAVVQQQEKEPVAEPAPEKEPEKIYEQTGYVKLELDTGMSDRYYVYYTDETEEEKLVEHARSLTYSDIAFTYVYYYNDKEKAPTYIMSNIETALLIKDHVEGRISIYQRTPNSNEFVWEPDMSDKKQL